METKTKWSPAGAADTPYMRARQEWDGRMGSAVVQARAWRRATFASLGAVGLALGGMTYLGAQPKAVPHIIEVDHLGAATYRGPVGQSGPDYTPSEAVLKYHLQRFLEDVRSVSSDAAVIKRNWLDAYTLVTSKGGNTLTAYVSQPEHDPFRRSADGERTSIEIAAAVRVSQDTWQVDWRETNWDKSGTPVAAPALWRGMFRILIDMPKTEEAMTRNPIGLFVDEFHWDTIQR
jgi:type IV secretion system protein VirB5